MEGTDYRWWLAHRATEVAHELADELHAHGRHATVLTIVTLEGNDGVTIGASTASPDYEPSYQAIVQGLERAYERVLTEPPTMAGEATRGA